MSPKHLFLTGYRGTGKSTIGRSVASTLGLPFIDTDIQIEKSAGKTIADIFAEAGEPGFRDLETAQLIGLESLDSPTVIALGGGAILRAENRECISRLGITVWLQASPENICLRIANDPNTQSRRPKLSKLGDLSEIRAVLAERWKWYEAVADFIVASDETSLDSACTMIVEWYRKTA